MIYLFLFYHGLNLYVSHILVSAEMTSIALISDYTVFLLWYYRLFFITLDIGDWTLRTGVATGKHNV